MASAQSDQQPVWEEITPTTGAVPNTRRNAAAINNPIDQSSFSLSAEDHGDLWRFDLLAESRERMAAEGTGPIPCSKHNAVYDEVSHRMRVWSGRKIDADGSELLSDVWALNVDDLQWSLLHPSGDAPNHHHGTAAIYDPLSHSLVNFAGFTTAARFDDTWASIQVGMGGRTLAQTEILVPDVCTPGPTIRVAAA